MAEGSDCEAYMIALYRGTSFMSWCIRVRTWSVYSHASWLTDDMQEYESWAPGGVTGPLAFGKNHTPGTQVDLYDFKIPLNAQERDTIRTVLVGEVGKEYDYAGVVGLTWVGQWLGIHHERKRWFCSELVKHACRCAGRLRGGRAPYRERPKDLSLEPELYHTRTIYVPDRLSLTLALT